MISVRNARNIKQVMIGLFILVQLKLARFPTKDKSKHFHLICSVKDMQRGTLP